MTGLGFRWVSAWWKLRLNLVYCSLMLLSQSVEAPSHHWLTPEPQDSKSSEQIFTRNLSPVWLNCSHIKSSLPRLIRSPKQPSLVLTFSHSLSRLIKCDFALVLHCTSPKAKLIVSLGLELWHQLDTRDYSLFFPDLIDLISAGFKNKRALTH